ncbi:hypothetical protein NA57DRAFT_61895 [Rhizodiscina lignyota]|uniref:Uncharacterized protein n=1 Tax=Rhizodiscina lignyota TaxID=1504668 RepID=A0A9P4M156_9PEZI|nr:hypothetical protein NA57DRAFT_61895 [Rhizodiscina lignyota]
MDVDMKRKVEFLNLPEYPELSSTRVTPTITRRSVGGLEDTYNEWKMWNKDATVTIEEFRSIANWLGRKDDVHEAFDVRFVPRIINVAPLNIAEMDTSEITPADAFVTFLYHTNPQGLRYFLDHWFDLDQFDLRFRETTGPGNRAFLITTTEIDNRKRLSIRKVMSEHVTATLDTDKLCEDFAMYFEILEGGQWKMDQIHFLNSLGRRLKHCYDTGLVKAVSYEHPDTEREIGRIDEAMLDQNLRQSSRIATDMLVEMLWGRDDGHLNLAASHNHGLAQESWS